MEFFIGEEVLVDGSKAIVTGFFQKHLTPEYYQVTLHHSKFSGWLAGELIEKTIKH
jgi:hypothetical protein